MSSLRSSFDYVSEILDDKRGYKTHAVLFFAEIRHLFLHGKSFFNEDVYMNEYGCQFKIEGIYTDLSTSCIEHLDAVIQKLKEYSEFTLVELSRQYPRWGETVVIEGLDFIDYHPGAKKSSQDFQDDSFEDENMVKLMNDIFWG